MNLPIYHRPASLERALAVLATERCAVLAGGTDFYPARVGKPVTGALLDITALRELRGIQRAADGGWRIGALTTWSDLVRWIQPAAVAAGQAVVPALFAGLVAAAREVGGVQIQNQGTIGGNLCNASPAADGVPALLALAASVELSSGAGSRVMPLEQFVQGNRRTALDADELLTAITIPAYSVRGLSRFAKLGSRRYLVISIAMVAITLDFEQDDRVSRCGIAVGSCSASARRLAAIEAALLSTPRRLLGQRVAQLLAAGEPLAAVLTPIDDVRGTASYRLHVVGELLQRLFTQIADEA